MARMSKSNPAVEESQVEDEQPQVEEQASAPAAPRSKKLKQYKITFHGEGGDVEIGHNFKMNLYKRNVETVIDENYLDVLRQSVTTTVTQDSAGNWKPVSIPAYQYSLGEQV